jgi:hypothetical protein
VKRWADQFTPLNKPSVTSLVTYQILESMYYGRLHIPEYSSGALARVLSNFLTADVGERSIESRIHESRPEENVDDGNVGSPLSSEDNIFMDVLKILLPEVDLTVDAGSHLSSSPVIQASSCQIDQVKKRQIDAN